MKLASWLGLLGVMTALGCLLVGQRSALTLQAYRLGAEVREAHRRDAEVAWLQTQVVSLASPTRLAAAAKEHKLSFVARRTLKEDDAQHPFVRIAAWLGGTP